MVDFVTFAFRCATEFTNSCFQTLLKRCYRLTINNCGIAKVKAGEQISLVDLANAVKADKERGKGAKPEKKPSIRAQLRADKEKAQKKNAKQKSQDLERS